MTGTKRFDICLGLIILSFFFSVILWKRTPVRKEVVERVVEKVKEVTPDNPCKSMEYQEGTQACEAAYTCKFQGGRITDYKGPRDFKCEYGKEIQEVKGN